MRGDLSGEDLNLPNLEDMRSHRAPFLEKLSLLARVLPLASPQASLGMQSKAVGSTGSNFGLCDHCNTKHKVNESRGGKGSPCG